MSTLIPKKAKHRKWQTGRRGERHLIRPDTRGLEISFGSHGLKSTSQARITSNQLEAARKVASRTLGKFGKVWIRVFPDRPVTAKPAEVGMGSGKGDPQGYVCEVRPGRIIFEVDGATESVAKEALRKANAKLPITGKIIARAK